MLTWGFSGGAMPFTPLQGTNAAWGAGSLPQGSDPHRAVLFHCIYQFYRPKKPALAECSLLRVCREAHQVGIPMKKTRK